jgi:hypothetical protein
MTQMTFTDVPKRIHIGEPVEQPREIPAEPVEEPAEAPAVPVEPEKVPVGAPSGRALDI